MDVRRGDTQSRPRNESNDTGSMLRGLSARYRCRSWRCSLLRVGYSIGSSFPSFAGLGEHQDLPTEDARVVTVQNYTSNAICIHTPRLSRTWQPQILAVNTIGGAW